MSDLQSAWFILGVICGAIICVILMKSVQWWFRQDIARLKEREFWWDSFQDQTQHLFAEPNLPSEAITILSALNNMATNKAAVAGLLKIARKTATATKVHPEISMLRRNHPETAKVFDRAIVAGLLAITYQSLVVGAFARSFMFAKAKRESDETSVYIAEAEETARLLAVA